MYSSLVFKICGSFLMRWSENVSRMGEKGNAYSVLVEKPEGKRLLRGPRLGGRYY